MPILRVRHWRVGKAAYLLMWVILMLSGALVYHKSIIDPALTEAVSHYYQATLQKLPTTALVTSNKPSSNSNSSKPSNGSTSKSSQTTNFPLVLQSAHQGLNISSSPILQKLAEYEKAVGGAFAGRVMVFTDMPDNASESSKAADMAAILKEFARFNIKPLVILEPVNSQGNLDFHVYSTGYYDSWLTNYFQSLKQDGIDSNSLGEWVYFPEANLPEWGPVDLTDFASNVTRSVHIQKSVFAGSLASIMLDSETYPNGSTNWGGGSYQSFSPYISAIPKGLVDSFGYQGFPWAAPPGSGEANSYDPGAYLSAQEAIDAAHSLGTTRIWLNTGTFTSMYSGTSQQVSLSVAGRQTMLNSTLQQALVMQQAGMSVAINIFSQDKSNTPEDTNWSYWTANQLATSQYTPLYVNFIHQEMSDGIEPWYFDSN